MDGRRARARAAPVHVTALLLALLGVPVLARAQIVPPAPEAQRAALPPSGTNLYTPPLPALALDPRYNGDTSPTLSPTTCVVTQVTHPPDHVCGDAGDASALPQHHTSYTHSHACSHRGFHPPEWVLRAGSQCTFARAVYDARRSGSRRTTTVPSSHPFAKRKRTDVRWPRAWSGLWRGVVLC
jgi:hypothetical protein